MHSLIIGTTGSGKTNLAKTLCRKFKQAGKPTLVLDPLMDDEWDCDFKTSDKAQFLDVVKHNKQCIIFVDESGQAVGKYDEEMAWLATTARHWGHQSIFICQRAQQISKTVRDQCQRIWIFRVSNGDAKILAEEFVQDELLEAGSLGKFEFFETGRFQKPVKGKIKKF